jgi:hypothetical protein
MQFIKFTQPDPSYKGRPAEVVLNVGQIVKIEPRWYEETEHGRYLAYVGIPDSEALERGLQKEYVLFDSLGNQYESNLASEKGRDLIEQLWLDAV